MEDSNIVDLYWRRSQQAIAETKKKYENLLYSVARNIVSIHEDAEECVNDTYLSAWNSMPKARPKYLSAFLCRIIKNKAFDKYAYLTAEKRNRNMEVSLSEMEHVLTGMDYEYEEPELSLETIWRRRGIMLDHRTIHNLMQKMDDRWIDEAVYAERKTNPFRKFAAAAAIVLICTLISTSVAAAISPTFREWLFDQFQGKKPVIEKMKFPEEITGTQNGFLIQNADENDTRVYCVENGEFKLCETRIWNSYVMFQEKRYDFSFKYVTNGKEIYAWDYQGAAVSVTGYDEYTGIVWLAIENVWNCYYIDYFAESKSSPVADPYKFKNLWEQQYYWDDNGEQVEGYVKLAVDMHVSPDGSWLLYRSNRDCLTTENGEYNTDAKGKWYVQNVKTGEEKLLPMASPYLHNNEIGFIDNDVISILYAEENNNHPVLYHCESGQIQKADYLSVTGSPYSVNYEMMETEKEYQFWDFYTDEMHAIPRSRGGDIRASYVGNDLICILETNGTVKVNLIKEKMVLNFGNESFKDIDAICNVYSLGDEQFVIIGEEKGELVGYLVVFN